MIESYGKVNNVGHADVRDLLNYDLVIEEKVDGSQISFGLDNDGVLSVHSRKQPIDLKASGMFQAAVSHIQSIKSLMLYGVVYRGEFLAKPKHNVLCYDRVPKNHIVLFDAETKSGHYGRDAKERAAIAFDIDCVPLLFTGKIESLEQLEKLIDRKSYLGGPQIEGVVLKAYGQTNRNGNLLKGKFVAEGFKEIHKRPKTAKPHRDIIDVLSGLYRTTARWEKAVQHLKEAGNLDESMRDVGELIKAVMIDVEEECTQEIKDELFKWAWPQIRKNLSSGLPDWYKNKMAESAFEQAR